MKISVSASAENDITEISGYIYIDNIVKADEFIQLIQENFFHISKIPKAYPIYYSDIRRKILNRFKNYAILYKLHPDYIEIIRVYHTSRDKIEI